jgi:hypothetical protein
LARNLELADFRIGTVVLKTNVHIMVLKIYRNIGQATNGCYFWSLPVHCWFCAVKCHDCWLIVSEVVNGV